MFTAPGPVECAECGRVPNMQDMLTFSICILCHKFLCPDHLVTRNGVGTCAACVTKRERRERSSGVSDADEAAVISLLRADVLATIGPGQDEHIIQSAAHHRLYPHPVDPGRYVYYVVEDVQQFFHDSIIDTSWPACPLHPNHPLWFSDGWWHCEQTKARIAALGALSIVKRSD